MRIEERKADPEHWSSSYFIEGTTLRLRRRIAGRPLSADPLAGKSTKFYKKAQSVLRKTSRFYGILHELRYYYKNLHENAGAVTLL